MGQVFMPFVPARRTGPELLDLPAGSQCYPELVESLADIRKVNRYLGGTRAAVRHFSGLLDGLGRPGGRTITLLDVATGSADVPAALVDWARASRLGISVRAVDINPAIARHASELTRDYPEIKVEVADALDLPYEDGSFDFVMCSLALHHFHGDDAMRLLKNIARIAGTGYVVGDLRRGWIPFALIYILTRLLTGNRLTRCDGPLSVLRAYTHSELEALAGEAGLKGYRVVDDPFWRMALVGRGVWAKT